MKKKTIQYSLLSFAIFWLMYDVYYWSMRSTAGVLQSSDKLICLLSGFICNVIIVSVIFKKHKGR